MASGMAQGRTGQVASGAEAGPPASGPRVAAPADAVVPLSHGRQAEVSGAGSVVEISSDEGTVELRVRITDTGPVLEFQGGRLALKSAGDLAIECRDLTLRATGTTTMESGGDFEQRVHGGYSVRVRDDARLAAQAVELEAELGELGLRANDDVALHGLRVLLNVPSEADLARREQATRSIEELLQQPFDDGQGPQRLPASGPKKRDLE